MKSPRKISHIGSTELISLPDQAILGIPAKVDTGADGSAIWASDIVEKDGELSFVLFSRASSLYTGERVKTRDYSISSIKNSFGQSEFRYKVRLKTILSGRIINVRFTLADRASNRYPVLIGRRTIHGKFLVDVSKSISRNKSRVLLLSMGRTSALEAYVDSLESLNAKMDITVATYDDLDFVVGKDMNITLASTGEDIASFDMVYFKTTAGYWDTAAAAAQYLRIKSVPFIDQAIQYFPSTSKLYQYVILAGGGIMVPRSLFLGSKRLKSSYDKFEKTLGLPFVLKDIHGKKGDYNYLIKNKESYAVAVAEASKAKVSLIGQEFIPNDGDYRVLVLGRRIELVIYRQAASVDTHLNNTSQGGKAILSQVSNLPADVQKHSIVAAGLLERQIAGVDMVQDNRTGSWYCFEVNDGPQLATGTFLAEKHQAVAAFLERRIKD